MHPLSKGQSILHTLQTYIYIFYIEKNIFLPCIQQKSGNQSQDKDKHILLEICYKNVSINGYACKLDQMASYSVLPI